MKKTKSPLLLACVALSLLSLIATVILLPTLPDQIPIHWNAAGEIDNYGSRYFTLLTGALPLGLLILFAIIPRIDPRKESFEKHAKAYQMVNLLLTGFMLVIHWVTLLVSLGYNLSVGMIVPISTGLLFIIIGNYLPQIRPNYTFGIRIPWALNNQDNWRATHRFGGYAFAFAGVFMILDGLFSHLITGYLTTTGIVICIFAPMLYSYIYYKNHEGKAK